MEKTGLLLFLIEEELVLLPVTIPFIVNAVVVHSTPCYG